MNIKTKISIGLLLLFTACQSSDNHSAAISDSTTTSAATATGNSVAESTPLHDITDTLLPQKKVVKSGKQIKTEIQAKGGNTITVTETLLPYYISGKCDGGAGGTVILDELHIGPPRPLYSQTINPDGLYDFSGETSEPTLLQLRLPAGAIHLVVYPSDTITVVSKLAHPENFTCGGSVETNRLREMYLILEAANAKKDAVTDALQLEKDNAKLRQLYAAEPMKLQQIDQEKRVNLEKFIDKVDTSFVAVLAALYLDPVENFDYIQKVVQKFQYKWPNSEYYNSLYKKYMVYLPLQNGNQAPEILSTTPDGKQMRLSDFKGKYVLIDFWASWCDPCVKQFPQLISLYNQYKSKGFEILGVSADDKKDKWVEGIKNNNLPWPQVSDVMGYNSGNLHTYLLTSIPDNFLIGPDGKIIAKHLDMVMLKDILAKRLGK